MMSIVTRQNVNRYNVTTVEDRRSEDARQMTEISSVGAAGL